MDKKTDIIYSLDFGEKQMIVTKSFDPFILFLEKILIKCFFYDIQKAIITIAQGFEEGFIKEAKKDELLKFFLKKQKCFCKLKFKR